MKTSKVFISSLLNDAFALLLIVMAWYIASILYPAYIIPSPAMVISASSSLVTADCVNHFGITVYRILIGFISAFGAGTLFGVMASLAGMQKSANSLMVALQVIPGTILGVIFLLMFGIGNATPILLTIFLTLPSIVINTVNGLSKRNLQQEQYLKVLSSSRWQIIRYSYIPALIPVLQSNVSLGVSLAAKVVILGEFIGSQNGLGYLLNNARILFDMKEVFFYLLVLMLFILVFQALSTLFFSLPLRKYFYQEGK